MIDQTPITGKVTILYHVARAKDFREIRVGHCPYSPPTMSQRSVPVLLFRFAILHCTSRHNISSLRDRSALLGGSDGYRASPSTSGCSTPFFDGGAGRQRTAEELESQNDERLEGLGAKVKMLKDVSQQLILMS